MSEVVSTVRLHGPQHDFVFAPEHFVVMNGGIGSGKSYGGSVRSLMASLGEIGGQVIPTPNMGVVTAATYKMLKDATFRAFREVADPYIASINRSDFLVTMINGSEILFRTATEPENLRGPNATWWWGDEAALYDPMAWKVMIGRLRQHREQGYAWLTTTPKGRNWVYQEFVQRERADYRFIQARTRQNPYLDRAFVAALEESYTGDFARQELLGEFVAFEGLIYVEFRRDTHTTTTHPDQFKRVIAGVDWGYANPGVILVVGIDSDDRMWVIHEEYQRQRRVEEWASLAGQLQALYRIETFYCDPSEPDYIQAFQNVGCYAEAAENAVMPGIQAVKNRLVVQGDGLPRLLVSSDAVNVLTEFEQYQWMESRDGVRDQPRKTNDHTMDALRYATLGASYAGLPVGGMVEASPVGALVGAY